MHAARHSLVRHSILSVRRASTASANNVSGTSPRVSNGAGPAGHGRNGPHPSQIVDEAVKRVASESPRRRRGLVRHSNWIGASVAAFVSVTALQHRREHERALSMSEAKAARLESERDAARAFTEELRLNLVGNAPVVISAMDAERGWFSTPEAARVGCLREWIHAEFESTLRDSRSKSNPSDSAKGQQLI